MSRSGSLSAKDLRAIVDLVGECRELGDDGSIWRRHLIEGLARLVGADLGSAGEMLGARTGAVRDLGVTHWMQAGLADPGVIESAMEEFRRDPARTPTVLAYFRQYAREDGLCLTRKDILDDRSWYASQDYEVVQRPCGLDHILWCFRQFPTARRDESSGIILTRAAGRRDFGLRDRTFVREAHAAVAAWVGGPLARFSEPSPWELPPRVRQVLACFLEGDSDKQVASRLSLSVHTVNQYAKVILRHFGVQSRPELLAIWIRRHSAGGFTWARPTGDRALRSGDSNATPSSR